MAFCSKCGNEETSDKSFCSKCGEKLQVFDDEGDFSKAENKSWSGMYVKDKDDGFFGRKNVNQRKKIIGSLVFGMFLLLMMGFGMWLADDSPPTKNNSVPYSQMSCYVLEELYVKEIDSDALSEWLKRCLPD